jgi:predicted dehydrogenase/nucleoside-diphosphate-sugar epimerase
MSRSWIITGANGYLGGQLCLNLAGRGESVTGMARAGKPLGHLLEAGIDGRSYEDLPEIISSGDILVHCAGLTGSRGSPGDYTRINRDWSVSLFDQAAAAGAGCFIFVSSIAAMGYMPRPSDAPLDESSPPRHAEGDYYGMSKLDAEKALQDRADSSSTRLVMLRPGLVYGRKPLSSARPEVIDRGQRVPLLHIDNFADAVVASAKSENARGVFIVVDEEQPIIGDLTALKMKLGILRHPPRRIGRVGFWMKWLARSIVRIMTGRRGEVSRKLIFADYYFRTRRLRYSTERLRSATGWIPAVGLEEGLRESGKAAESTAPEAARKITPAVLFRAAYNRLALRADRGPIGIGLIGVGGWGSTNAANIMRSKRFKIVGVYDQRTETAESFARRYGTKRFASIEEMLDEPGIVAVAATIPNHYHEEVVKAAADARKHIFMEKPLACDAFTCRELGRYCREREVILQVGHQMRREPVFREITRLVEEGSLGLPLSAHAIYTLDRRSRSDWRRDPGCCPGGSMEQLGAHMIDLLIALFGPPSGMESWEQNIHGLAKGPEWACIMMSFEGVLYAAVSTSFSSPDFFTFKILFEGGELETDGSALLISRKGSKPGKTRPRGRGGGVDQFMEFARCIEEGGKPETGAQESAAVMDVVGTVSCSMEATEID